MTKEIEEFIAMADTGEYEESATMSVYGNTSTETTPGIPGAYPAEEELSNNDSSGSTTTNTTSTTPGIPGAYPYEPDDYTGGGGTTSPTTTSTTTEKDEPDESEGDGEQPILTPPGDGNSTSTTTPSEDGEHIVVPDPEPEPGKDTTTSTTTTEKDDPDDEEQEPEYIPVAPPTIPVSTTTEETPRGDEHASKDADPVDVYSGAHLLQNRLMQLFGGQNLSLTAYYNSSRLVNGTLGVGWYHNYEKYVEVSAEEAYVYENPSVYCRFTVSENSTVYVGSTPGKLGYTLTVDATAAYPYCVNCNKERLEYYDVQGRLAKIVNRQGFETVIGYGDTVISVTDQITGKSMYLEQNAAGKIARVYDDAGREAVLTYINDYLTGICDVNGHSLLYSYNDGGRVEYGVDDANVKYFTNTYDAEGRVSTQKDGVGSPETVFAYGENGVRCTTDRSGVQKKRVFSATGQLVSYTDGCGNTKTYECDENCNVIKETDALGHFVAKVFNAYNQPTQITDPNGNTTYYTYDGNGNLTRIVYPGVDGVSAVETYEYNSRNQVIRHTDRRGTVTVYTYDANGMPAAKQTGDRSPITYTFENGLLVSETDARGNTTRCEYNALGQCIRKIDGENRTTAYEYDLSGNLLKVTDAENNSVTYTYDCNYQKASVTDAAGNTTHYSYTGNLKNDMVTMPDGYTVHYEYDNEDRPIRVTDQAGNVTVTTYDPAGRILAKQAADGGVTAYEYDAAGRVIRETNPKGAVTGKTYDANGNVLTVTDADGGVTSFQYDALSRLVRKVNAVSGAAQYTYSAAGDLLTETDALGGVKRYTYDAYGNRITATDARGNTTSYAYDANGNLLRVTDALGNATAYTYNSKNQMLTAQDAKNHTTTYGYDALGRQTTVTDACGHTFTKAYDGNGNVVRITDAKGNTVSETTYNSLNLAETVTDAAGKTTTYTYNELGKVETVTDALNNRQQYTYNARGRQMQVIDADGHATSAAYDVLGNITRLFGPLGGCTEYTYDDLGRLIAETTTSGGKITYGYNAMHLREEIVNARGQSKQFTYDALGRVTNTVSVEDTVQYTYDANGNVLTVTDKNGTITRTYDALNRVSAYTDTYGNTIRYTYDSVGNLVTITYPDDTAVAYEYDAVGNLTTVTDWAGRTTTYTYDENNHVIGVVKPDGSTTTTAYDAQQRITSTVETTASGTVISGFEYAYDDLSRIVEEKVLAKNTKLCYTYDDLNRVTKRTTVDLSTGAETVEPYSYDGAGNIHEDGTAYDTNNRLTLHNYQTVAYDADGNMTSAGNLYCTYDSANRLTSAGGHTYTYNAENTRIRNNCGLYDTTYVYNTNARLSQLLMKTTNGIVTKYVYGLGLIGEEKQGFGFKTYHFDYRGSTVAITDVYGNITDTFEYDTYGNVTSHVGNSFVIFGYNGRDGVITDSNGLIYMRARYYAPHLKRFVNADTVSGEITKAITLNRYAYANGNPISLVDPFGLSAERGTVSSEFPPFTGLVDPNTAVLEPLTLLNLSGNSVGLPNDAVVHYLDEPIVIDTSKDSSIDWSKIFGGGLLVAGGLLTIAAVVLTGGTCTPLVALGYAALATGGTVATRIGIAEIEEGFTGTNELKGYVGDHTYDLLQNGSVAVMTMGLGIIQYGSTVSVCFVEGTPVLTKDGNVPIETVKAGDTVWAEDPDTGETALKRVVRTFVNESNELVHVRVNGEEIVSTPKHPYYVVTKGWLGAAELCAGDTLVLKTGEYATVEAVLFETLDIPVKVYNFEVEDFHTYFVGSSAVLVHNKCIVNKNGVKIEVRTSNEHGIPHGHVSGNGPNTTVGLDGFPMKNHPPYSNKQSRVIQENWERIVEGIENFFPKTH